MSGPTTKPASGSNENHRKALRTPQLGPTWLVAASPSHLCELSSASTSMPNTPSSSPPLLALSSWELLLPHMPWVFNTLHNEQCTSCGHHRLTDGLRSHVCECKAQPNAKGNTFWKNPLNQQAGPVCRGVGNSNAQNSHRQHCGVGRGPAGL